MEPPRPPALPPPALPPRVPPGAPPGALPPAWDVSTSTARPAVPGAPPPLPARPCLDCGAPVEGAFCPRCGQAYRESREVTARVTFGDLVQDLVRVNGHFVRTLWLLVSRPGLLTADFLAGRRTRHDTPARLFLVVNFVVFLLAQWFDPETAKGVAGFVGMDAIEAAADERGVSVAHYAVDFEAKLNDALPAGFVVLVPLFALALTGLYRRERRSYAAHGVFAFHFVAAALVAFVPGTLLTAASADEAVMSVAVFLAIPLWLVVAMRRVYTEGWVRTVLKAAVAWTAFFALLMLYYVVVVVWAVATA